MAGVAGMEALLAADTAARVTALTALDRSLLVEAGAGSGKTSVLAGRVACLLAAGRHPGRIAAITFTELAAGELRERVCLFVSELARGEVRRDLAAAFPDGPTTAQRGALRAAEGALDELVCTTIHGFCQRLLTPYPVEAGMDPGAAVMDASAADTLFEEVLDHWLRDRLSGAQTPDDLLLALYADAPGATDVLLRGIAAALRRHRGATVPEMAVREDAVAELRVATASFRRFVDGAACQEAATMQIVEELEALLRAFEPGASVNEATVLRQVLAMGAPAAAARKDGSYGAYRKLTAWRQAVRASRSAMAAERLNEEASVCYEACREAHAAARAYAAGRILHLLADEIAGLLACFQAAKRDRALTDFDDLLVQTRDLLRGHEPVRAALAERLPCVLVDEFQDTDPLQCEILWRLCGTPDPGSAWQDWTLRPGALFLVGDPKQAIYRFRGADVRSYVEARARLVARDAGARLVIGQNFRSTSPILDWVNGHFAGSLAGEGQPGFEPLFTSAAAPDGHVAVAVLPVEVQGAGAGALRDAEAEAVAACCARLVGALMVRGREGLRPCRPDDIALLAPTGTDLWRTERALEAAGIAVSTQAGKGFYRRQEVQDLITLTRVLADGGDTLALGALLRGPLVGLTENELLDAVEALPKREGVFGRLRLWTELADIAHPLLRETLAILQGLARRARTTTPFVLLGQAVEELQLRPLLRQRQGRTAERALANLDLFLEGARPYDVRGLPALAADLRAQWDEARRAMEGRPDAEEHAVSLVTMHSAKGLEWPVVIPINMGGGVSIRTESAVDAQGRLHLPVLGVHGPDGAATFASEGEEEERQRFRLWYVGATRARDLLLLPSFSTGVPNGSWMERVGLVYDGIEPFDAARLPAPDPRRAEDEPNDQDRATYEAEAARIASGQRRIRRVAPHLAEAGEDLVSMTPAPAPMSRDEEDAVREAPPPRGSQARGLVLHKLLEEVLTGETAGGEAALTTRAAELIAQLHGAPGVASVDPTEAARSVRRGLATPEIETVRDRLSPEYVVAHSASEADEEVVTSGVADAVVCDVDGIELVVDWKSDVRPNAAAIAKYRGQVSAYLRATGAPEGLIVFLTSGQVERVPAKP